MHFPFRDVPEHHLLASAAVFQCVLLAWTVLDRVRARTGAARRPRQATFGDRVGAGTLAGVIAAAAVVSLGGLSLEAPRMVPVGARYGSIDEIVQFLVLGATGVLFVGVVVALPSAFLSSLLVRVAPLIARPPIGATIGFPIGVSVSSWLLSRAWWCGNTTSEEIVFGTTTLFTASALAAMLAGAVAARGPRIEPAAPTA